MAPVSNWTGWYAGLNLGYGFNDPTVTTTPNDTIGAILVGIIPGGLPQISYGMDGIIGGAQVGYNWQTATNWVVGLEADIQGTSLKGSGVVQLPTFMAGPAAFLNASQEVKWYGTLRGRLGWLANDRLMVFGTGGLAYGGVKETSTLGYLVPLVNGAGAGGFFTQCTLTNNCYNGSSTRVQVGYTLGAGLEYALWQNMTVKAEYMYVNLGSSNLTSVSNPSGVPGQQIATLNAHFSDLYFNVVRVGANWRF